MTPEDIWRRKSDDDVIVALMNLGEYTQVGQRVIRLEAARRGLEVTPLPAYPPSSSQVRQPDGTTEIGDPPPDPGIFLVVCTGLCGVWCLFLAYMFVVGFPPWKGFDSNYKVGAVGTAVGAVGKLFKEWTAHFERKAAWQRRQSSLRQDRVTSPS